MRVVVTGAMNAYGRTIVEALARDGHAVRAFGVPPGEDPFHLPNVLCHPGRVETGGSIEPVLSERQVLVHAACLDAPGKDKHAHALKVLRGTLYARYGAEREQVDHFLHLAPAQPERAFAAVQQEAAATARATRGILNVRVLEVTDPASAAEQVRRALRELPELGTIQGADDAVTA